MIFPKIEDYLAYYQASAEGLNTFMVWVLTVSCVVVLLYYVVIFSRLIFYRPKNKRVEPYPVSVIIASRDDAKMLKRHLPLLMAQEEIEFEVIVVDDCSLDDTVDVIREYAAKYPNFRHSKLIESGDFEGGKKYAITIGIKAAKYAHLVFLDADCYPTSTLWLRKMAEGLMFKKVVLGFGPYKKEPGLLNKLIRYDAFKIGQQYLSFAISGIPYMGVGRNMGYHSNLYFDSKGFSSHLNVVSGDDDLFLNAVANRKNTGIEIEPDSFVYSIAKPTYALWEFQKRRHLTTATRYKWYHQVLLALLPMAQYLFVMASIYFLIVGYALPLLILLWVIKLVVQGVVSGINMYKLKSLDLFIWSVILEPMLMIFYPWVTFLNIVKGDQRKRWI